MKECDLGPVDYIGADIVDELIEELRSRYENSRRRFRVLELVTDSLPRADLVLCREVFVHLSFGDAGAALENIKKCGAT